VKLLEQITNAKKRSNNNRNSLLVLRMIGEYKIITAFTRATGMIEKWNAKEECKQQKKKKRPTEKRHAHQHTNTPTHSSRRHAHTQKQALLMFFLFLRRQ
jgi:ABC-type nickel/cobalt efflux system permease component RcnA